MTPIQVRTLAEHLMHEHGLLDLGWRFELDRARKRFGLCSYRRKVISLSVHLSRLNPDDVRDTVLHEIAHALVGPGHGHKFRWRAKARAIGADARRCCKPTTTLPPGTWEATCKGCGHTFKRFKRPRAGRQTCCARCARQETGRSVFCEAYALEYVRKA